MAAPGIEPAEIAALGWADCEPADTWGSWQHIEFPTTAPYSWSTVGVTSADHAWRLSARFRKDDVTVPVQSLTLDLKGWLADGWTQRIAEHINDCGDLPDAHQPPSATSAGWAPNRPTLSAPGSTAASLLST